MQHPNQNARLSSLFPSLMRIAFAVTHQPKALMSQDFAGKIIVISGASRGIGLGIATAFAARGAQTVLAASSLENLQAAADAIASTGALRQMVVATDPRTEAGCQTVFDRVSEEYGRCDVLVNSAGATKAGTFLDLPDAAWQDGFALKFFGCVNLCRFLWPFLKMHRAMWSTSLAVRCASRMLVS
jgi:NAD(P)-dependent dehydrogenase (short-subunit alcohol dehydrogenase family)